MIALAERIRATSGCRLLKAAGLPVVEAGHTLPRDVTDFYTAAGGADLYFESDFGVRISQPDDLVLANPVIIGRRVPDDITDSWYIIGRGASGESISIDLHPDRLGRCYDSFSEVHGLPGSCAVVATSFADLISRLLAAGGRHWYWLEPDFTSLGDAYDVVR